MYVAIKSFTSQRGAYVPNGMKINGLQRLLFSKHDRGFFLKERALVSPEEDYRREVQERDEDTSGGDFDSFVGDDDVLGIGLPTDEIPPEEEDETVFGGGSGGGSGAGGSWADQYDKANWDPAPGEDFKHEVTDSWPVAEERGDDGPNYSPTQTDSYDGSVSDPGSDPVDAGSTSPDPQD